MKLSCEVISLSLRFSSDELYHCWSKNEAEILTFGARINFKTLSYSKTIWLLVMFYFLIWVAIVLMICICLMLFT